MRTILKPLALAALLTLNFLSSSAHAFTVKGITAGMPLESLIDKFPSGAFKHVDQNYWDTSGTTNLNETVGGQPITYIGARSQAPDTANQITIKIDCGLSAEKFYELMVQNYGPAQKRREKPGPGDSITALWIKENSMMFFSSLARTDGDHCHIITLLDELATKNFLGMAAKIKSLKNGSASDF